MRGLNQAKRQMPSSPSLHGLPQFDSPYIRLPSCLRSSFAHQTQIATASPATATNRSVQKA